MTATYAKDLGRKLTTFANTNIPSGPKFTVIGHSYGGTTVAQSEALGLAADRVLYLAPAGYGQGPNGKEITGLSDFPRTGNKPHYSMMGRQDLVVGLVQDDPMGIHGKSPMSDPAVTWLETGWLKDQYHSAGRLDSHPIDSHSAITRRGTTAWNNTIAVVTGGTAKAWAGEYGRTWDVGPDGEGT